MPTYEFQDATGKTWEVQSDAPLSPEEQAAAAFKAMGAVPSAPFTPSRGAQAVETLKEVAAFVPTAIREGLRWTGLDTPHGVALAAMGGPLAKLAGRAVAPAIQTVARVPQIAPAWARALGYAVARPVTEIGTMTGLGSGVGALASPDDPMAGAIEGGMEGASQGVLLNLATPAAKAVLRRLPERLGGGPTRWGPSRVHAREVPEAFEATREPGTIATARAEMDASLRAKEELMRRAQVEMRADFADRKRAFDAAMGKAVEGAPKALAPQAFEGDTIQKAGAQMAAELSERQAVLKGEHGLRSLTSDIFGVEVPTRGDLIAILSRQEGQTLAHLKYAEALTRIQQGAPTLPLGKDGAEVTTEAVFKKLSHLGMRAYANPNPATRMEAKTAYRALQEKVRDALPEEAGILFDEAQRGYARMQGLREVARAVGGALDNIEGLRKALLNPKVLRRVQNRIGTDELNTLYQALDLPTPSVPLVP